VPDPATLQRSVVDEIRLPFLESLESEWKAGRRENALVMLRERGVSKDLIQARYSGRYPFELLQNAEDAAAENEIVGRAHFEVTDTALLVADNGAGFADRHVRAISTLGASTKDPETAIGYKGLGFKSIGEITDRPQIVSRHHWFEFNGARARDAITGITGELEDGFPLPTYALPFPISLSDFGEDAERVQGLLDAGSTTVFRLPLRPGVTRETVATHVIDTLRPRLLLFLRATESVEVRGTGQDFVARIDRQFDGDAQVALLDVNGEVTEWLIYSGRPAGASAPPSTVTNPRLSVAVPVLDGSPVVDWTFPLQVYFPTEEQSGYPFIVNADWELHLDRRQLSDTPEGVVYNAWLTQQMADFLTGAVLPSLDHRLGMGAALLSITPRSAASGHGTILQAAVIERLKEIAIVPTRHGTTAIAAGAGLLPATVADPTEALELCRDDGLPTVPPAAVHKDATVRNFLSGTLGVTAVGVDAVLAALHQPDPETAERYYRFLLEVDKRAGRTMFAGSLANAPCVITDHGVMRPSDRPFFPREAGGDELPAELQVPVARLPVLPGLDDLMKQAGVQEFRWREVVLNFLVPRLAEATTPPELRGQALDALRVYVGTGQRRGDQQVQEAVGRTLLPGRSLDGNVNDLRPAAKLYLPQAWTGSDAMEILYGPFGQADFLAAEPPDDGDERDEWLDLYRFLGVASAPRVDTARARDRWALRSLANHPHHDDPQWETWWQYADSVGAKVCSHGHDVWSQQLRESHLLDRFQELVDSGDIRRLTVLWNELANGWRSYEAATDAVVHCAHRFHNGDRDRRIPSILMHGLKTAAWIPGVVDGTWRASTASEVWRRALGTPAAVARVVPLLPADLLRGHARALADDLDINDAGRPTPDELVALMESLAERADVEESVPDELASAARWALATLNTVLAAEQRDALQRPVRIIAEQAGRLVFAASPVVARDPLLRESFTDLLPVVSVESDLRRTFSYFGLQDLDAVVVTTPRPNGARPDLIPELKTQLEQALPWIYALILNERPSAKDDARRRLKRLSVEFCDDLTLDYLYPNGDTDILITRDEAVAYIAEETRHLQGAVSQAFGNGFVEIDDSGRPYWYSFGRQLAQYLRTGPLGDAFGMILASSTEERRRLLADRRIGEDAVRAAAAELDLPIVEPEPEPTPNVPLLADPVIPAPSPAAPGTAAPDATPRTMPVADHVESPEPAPPPDLAVDEISVEVARSGRIPAQKPQPATGPEWIPNLGPKLSRDHVDSRGVRTSAIGRRGEEAAHAAERRRVRELGLDENEVEWVALDHPLAPFDIKSVDLHGEIYIEVKSTTSSDPTTPFSISQSEVVVATRAAKRYFIYRVTSVDTATPRVHRYEDPMAMVDAGTAVLNAADAQMRFGEPIIGGDPPQL